MRKVKELKILGKTYRVTYTDGFKDGDMLEGKFGKTCYNTQNIYLDASVADEQIIDSFFHEVFHVFSSDLALKFSEEQVVALGSAMCDFIINNSEKMVFTK